MVNLLTAGGPGSTTELASITLKREAFEKWRTGYASAFAVILLSRCLAWPTFTSKPSTT
jgi:multiple sugar transport system permease protein